VTPERRAGRGIGPDGTLVVWSRAQGTRGTRWRSTRSDARGVISVLTMETTPDGRLDRLELATDRGMLTLHPDSGRGALHGNVVTADGVRHLELPWSPEHALVVDDEPLALEAAVARLVDPIGDRTSDAIELQIVRLDRRLEPETASLVLEIEPNGSTVARDPLTGQSVRLAGPPSGRPLDELADAADWPLERD
jgi:hypothetical protein